MNKEQTIKTVEQHIKQQEFLMFRVKSLIVGKSDNDPVDIYARDAHFKSTIMNPANRYLDLMGATFYDEIVSYYEVWFDECKKIYEILFKDPTNMKKPKLNSISEADIDVLKSRYDDLNDSNKKLLDFLKTSLQRLNALNESKFPG